MVGYRYIAKSEDKAKLFSSMEVRRCKNKSCNKQLRHIDVLNNPFVSDREYCGNCSRTVFGDGIKLFSQRHPVRVSFWTRVKHSIGLFFGLRPKLSGKSVEEI